MYIWEGLEFAEAAAAIAERDPRKYRFGLATASTADAPLEHSALRWFATVGELNQYALRVEPRSWGVAMAELIDLKQRLSAVTAAVDVQGLTNSLRLAYNAISGPAFQVLWWGSLESLRHGEHPWSLLLIAEYRKQERTATLSPVSPRETEHFLAFVRDTVGARLPG